MARRSGRTVQQRHSDNGSPPGGDGDDPKRTGSPTVLKLDKKKKRGSSRVARRLEDIERRVSKSVDRVALALEHGTSDYIKARDKSARKRRDGALVDIYQNVARGVSTAIAEASPALVDVAKALNTRGRRKAVRRALKRLPRLPAIV